MRTQKQTKISVYEQLPKTHLKILTRLEQLWMMLPFRKRKKQPNLEDQNNFHA